MRYITYSVVLLMVSLVSVSSANAQLISYRQNLCGEGSGDTLISVSIHNITAQRYDLSDEDGSYKIQAAPGDHVAFSSVGYRADILTITASLLSAACPIYLDIRPQTLQAVRVGEFSNYQLDSMDRHKEYSWVYDHFNTPRLDHDRKGDGVGVEMNIFRGASSAAKERERLQKRLQKEEPRFSTLIPRRLRWW